MRVEALNGRPLAGDVLVRLSIALTGEVARLDQIAQDPQDGPLGDTDALGDVADRPPTTGATQPGGRGCSRRTDGGESREALATILGDSRTWLVVSHGGPIRMAIEVLLGVPVGRLSPVAPASATVLDLDDPPRLLAYNLTSPSSRSTGSASSPCPRRPMAMTSPGLWARSRRRVSWTAPSAIRAWSSGRSAR